MVESRDMHEMTKELDDIVTFRVLWRKCFKTMGFYSEDVINNYPTYQIESVK